MEEQIENLKNVLTELKTLRLTKIQYLTHIEHAPVVIQDISMPVNSASEFVKEAIKNIMISEFWLQQELYRLEDIEDPLAFLKREGKL